MPSLATVAQRGAQRFSGITSGRTLKNGGCFFTCSPKHHLIPNIRQGQTFSGSPLKHYRCFSASSPDQNQKTPSFSYVVVGAGSAGCVLTNRLTEDAHESVLLLEAGPKDLFLGSLRLSWKIHMPAALTYNLCDDK